jgi:hypothetical protein
MIRAEGEAIVIKELQETSSLQRFRGIQGPDWDFGGGSVIKSELQIDVVI